MYSIKIKAENEWILVGNSKGQPDVYKTSEMAQKALSKIDVKHEPRLVGAIPTVVLK